MILVNPFTGATLNADVPNPEGCNQHTGPGCGRSHGSVSKKIDKLRSDDFYEDPSTGKVKKTKERVIGVESLSQDQLLRFAGDVLGIETDDMEPYGVDVEDTKSIREYVRKYAKEYAGLKLK
jgi:hypothetical protein